MSLSMHHESKSFSFYYENLAFKRHLINDGKWVKKENGYSSDTSKAHPFLFFLTYLIRKNEEENVC